MSLVGDIVTAVQGLAEAVGATAADPADRTRLLVALAAVAQPQGGNAPLAALCRRAALAELARASADYQPRSYDDAVAMRDLVCGLLQMEELAAADAFDSGVANALRALRGAVSRDLTRRGANLSPLRTVRLQERLPSLVVAHRLYGDATREPELVRGTGDPPNPALMPGEFRALAR